MKTADGGLSYSNDNKFLYKCFIWAGISQMNKCISKETLLNQFCFLQNTEADKILNRYKTDNIDRDILNSWNDILLYLSNTEEYNQSWTYGLYQIDKEINVKTGSGTFNKKNEEIMIPKYRKLDEKISLLKDKLKHYYNTEIKPKLFKYQLLK